MRIANGMVSFDFDDQTGSLTQIRDLRSGKRFLNDAAGSRLVKLIVPMPEHSSRPLYSHEAGRPDMITRDGGLQIRFPEWRCDGRATGIGIEVDVRLEEGSPEAFFTITIRNNSPYRIHEMWFPYVGGKHLKPGQVTITTSNRKGSDPYDDMARGARETHAFGRHMKRWGGNPWSTLPMIDLTEKGGGLSFIKYENRPSPNVAVFENMGIGVQDHCFAWTWATGVFVEPGSTWTSCAFGIGVHQGDWHETADRLRRWVETWWRPCDTPRSVREKIGLFHVQAHGFSGETHNPFTALPAIAADAMRYGVRDMMLWDCAASVYYRPDDGGFWDMPRAGKRELKQALAEIRGMGCSVSAFVNWRLAAEHSASWPAMAPLVQEGIFGKPLYGYPPATMDGGVYGDMAYERGTHSVCCGADGFLPFARSLLKKTFDLGFNAIAVDQAAEWNACFSREHGHASPWEAWERTYAWFAEVTRKTRSRDPEAYTLAELCDLYNTQHIDVWWNWDFRSGDWIRADVLRYVLPPLIPCWCIDENQGSVLAEAFAVGSFLAIATRDMTGRLSDAPRLAGRIAALATMRKATAGYVSHGRFLDRTGLTVRGGDGFVYASRRGLAVTLANRNSRQSRMRVQLQPEALPCNVGRDAVCHIEGHKPARARFSRSGEILTLDLVLPPHGAGILTLQRATGS